MKKLIIAFALLLLLCAFPSDAAGIAIRFATALSSRDGAFVPVPRTLRTASASTFLASSTLPRTNGIYPFGVAPGSLDVSCATFAYIPHGTLGIGVDPLSEGSSDTSSKVSPENCITETTSQTSLSTDPSPNAPQSLKSEVAAAFDDYPEMTQIVACESGYRQFRSNGTPLVSPTGDVGVMQIHVATWGKEAAALGLDIYGSAHDNIVMGRIVLETQGIKAWRCYNYV